jgi:hypothetical protein
MRIAILPMNQRITYTWLMGEIIPLLPLKSRRPWPHTLQPFTWRDRLANFVWLVLGIPLSLAIVAFGICGVFHWFPF